MTATGSIQAVGSYASLAQVLAMQQLTYSPRTVNGSPGDTVPGYRTKIGTPRIANTGRTDLYL